MPRRKKTKPTQRKEESQVENAERKETSRSVDTNTVKLEVEITSCDNLTSSHAYRFGIISITLHELSYHYLISDTLILEFKAGSPNCCIYSKVNETGEVQVTQVRLTATCRIPYDVLQCLSTLKIFIFTANSHVLHPGNNHIGIYIKPSSFITLKNASEPYFNHQKKKMFRLLQFFLNIEFNEYEENYLYDEEQVEKVYNTICNHYDPESLDASVTHNSLIPKLRLYQSQAVQWMLKRENPEKNYERNLHTLYTTVKIQDGQELYFHKYGGFFVNHKYASEEPCKGGILADEMGLGKTLEVLACILLNPRNSLKKQEKKVSAEQISNGLSENIYQVSNQKKKRKLSLSEDESMELDSDFQDTEFFECVCGNINSSKNICKPWVKCRKCNVIQHAECVLFKPESSSEDYTCPYCWITNSDLVPSRATLIISPESIVHQWEEEIIRHVKKDCLKIFMYRGVEHQKFIEPSYLADHDVVLTSYETLRRELKYVDLPHGDNSHSLRHPKKFMAIPSPMCSIEWWRICLDEAQMVESVSTKTAKMTGKLHSINRWCVTGTPIKKSIEDLYGLLLFLEVKPYQEKLWWKEVLWKPFVNGDNINMLSVLKDIAWRTTKKQVLDQILIPELREVVHKLDFTPLEKVYYDRQHSCCRRNFVEKIEKFDSWDMKLKSIDKHVLSKILLPLRHLQLTCCLCKVRRTGDIKKTTMSPIELLDHMLRTAKYECEDVHRKLIMALNGLAGIYLLLESTQDGVETYEKALKSIEDNKLNFRTDVTQKIHSMFHLSNVLSISEKNNIILESKFISSDLNAKVNELSTEYMEKCKALVVVCKNNVEEVNSEISLIMDDFKLTQKRGEFRISSWWLAVFESLKEEKEVFLEKLKEVLNQAPGKTWENLRSGHAYFDGRLGILRLWEIPSKLSEMYVELHTVRKVLKRQMEFVSKEPSEYDFKTAVNCHLRPIPNSGMKGQCMYCEADYDFKRYETKLFRFDESSESPPQDENICFSALRRGTHADSDLELSLKFILKYCRQKGLHEYIEDGTNDLKLLDAFKKEFKCLRNLWLKCCEYASQKDEIEMAKISSSLIDPKELRWRTDQESSYKLYPHEVEPRMIQYKSDIKDHQSELTKRLGHLFYLQNLEKAENKDAPFEEMCPVCQQTFENSWSVLQCGHNFCLVCMERLLSSQVSFLNKLGVACTGIQCPVCRQYTAQSDVYFIDKEKIDKKIEIQGSHSTKTTAVVMCLLDIMKNDPTAKSLVFSSFTDCLYVLEEALEKNNIKCINFCKKARFQRRLKLFKEEEFNVLLIPLSFGCSGLNLTEASNVLLVEPVLEDSKHLQAIGRIHRIGQTKETTVHRFFIAKSIEESIYNIKNVCTNDDRASTDMTLQNIINIFLQC